MESRVVHYAILCIVGELLKYPLKRLCINALSSTPGWTRTTGQWLKRTLFVLEYQTLTESSDLRVTIFCPGLSRNAAFLCESGFILTAYPHFNNTIFLVWTNPPAGGPARSL